MKKKRAIMFTVIFTFVFIYLYQNLDVKHTKKFFIWLQVSWGIMFGAVSPGNIKDIIAGVQSFKYPIHTTTKKIGVIYHFLCKQS